MPDCRNLELWADAIKRLGLTKGTMVRRHLAKRAGGRAGVVEASGRSCDTRFFRHHNIIAHRSRPMRISRRGDWLTALVGEELVMMSAKHGNDISPTAVGARVSATIDPSLTLDDLVARLTVEFEVSDETCRVKVPSYLEELAGHGAIAFDPPPTGSRHPA